MKKKYKVIILGAGGFISKNVENLLNKSNIKLLPLPRKKIDLTKFESIKKLSKIVKEKDIIFFAAADAPVKNENMLLNNLMMAKNMCEVLKKIKPSFFLYLSSDAVYSDTKKKIDENTSTVPNSLHGIMHLTREIMFENLIKRKLCIVRPTLVYGEEDPHNGYGPNRFMRLIKRNQKVSLFGKGEELRDHVWINDVSIAISKLIINRKIGKFNLVTGKVISFNNIAKQIIDISKKKSEIFYLKRKGPMPHGGYRAFKNSRFERVFPTFKFKSFQQVLKYLYKKK
jgi:UDP-glucose 4-epimerase